MHHPTELFTNWELQNPPQDVPELNKIRQSPDRKAKKMRKGRSGNQETSINAYGLRTNVILNYIDKRGYATTYIFRSWQPNMFTNRLSLIVTGLVRNTW